MKQFILILTSVVALVSRSAIAQELYQYAKDSVITTNVGQMYVLDFDSVSFYYSHATPVFNQYEPATCSDPTMERDEYGRWIVDRTKYTKPSRLQYSKN